MGDAIGVFLETKGIFNIYNNNFLLHHSVLILIMSLMFHKWYHYNQRNLGGLLLG